MGAQQDNATGKTFTGAQLIVYLLERQRYHYGCGDPRRSRSLPFV